MGWRSRGPTSTRLATLAVAGLSFLALATDAQARQAWSPPGEWSPVGADPSKSAFNVNGNGAVHVRPDDKTDGADLPSEMKYIANMLPAGYTDCSQVPLSNPAWVTGKPADGTIVKCIYVTGFALKNHGKANFDVSLEFALKKMDGFPTTAQQLFRAGFPFRSTTKITLDGDFGKDKNGNATPMSIALAGKSYSAVQPLGLVLAGKQVTALGGYTFGPDGYGIQNARVTIWNTAAAASCTTGTPVAETKTASDGFWFIWNTGDNNNSVSTANNLPSGVKYYVKVCDVIGIPNVNWPARYMDHNLGNKEFDEEDFLIAPTSRVVFVKQPANTKANANFTVTGQLVDSYGQNVTTDNVTQVTLDLSANPGGATLTCASTTATVVNGLATFSNCKLNVIATSYQLRVSSPGLQPSTSNYFNITK